MSNRNIDSSANDKVVSLTLLTRKFRSNTVNRCDENAILSISPAQTTSASFPMALQEDSMVACAHFAYLW